MFWLYFTIVPLLSTIWPKFCGHLTIILLCAYFHKYFPFAVLRSSTLPGRTSTRCWSIAMGICNHYKLQIIRYKSISEMRHRWKPGVQSELITKEFSGVEVFHTNFSKPCFHGARCHTGLVLLVPVKQKHSRQLSYSNHVVTRCQCDGQVSTIFGSLT